MWFMYLCNYSNPTASLYQRCLKCKRCYVKLIVKTKNIITNLINQRTHLCVSSENINALLQCAVSGGLCERTVQLMVPWVVVVVFEGGGVLLHACLCVMCTHCWVTHRPSLPPFPLRKSIILLISLPLQGVATMMLKHVAKKMFVNIMVCCFEFGDSFILTGIMCGKHAHTQTHTCAHQGSFYLTLPWHLAKQSPLLPGNGWMSQ